MPQTAPGQAIENGKAMQVQDLIPADTLIRTRKSDWHLGNPKCQRVPFKFAYILRHGPHAGGRVKSMITP